MRQRGFTLIEVLAAIALLAIAFAVGLGALGKSAQNAAQAAALDTAVERAQSLLAGQGLAAPLEDSSRAVLDRSSAAATTTTTASSATSRKPPW